MSHGMTRVFLALTLLAGLAGPLCADGVWSVGRSTNDRDADLVDAMIQRQRFDDALSICRMLGRGADPERDAAAKWAIQRSRVLVARQMGQDQFNDTDIQTASEPVADLVSSYPEHRRRFFLAAQLLMVQRSAALHGVLRAAVAPADDAARDEATKNLLRATAELESLIKEIGDARIVLDQHSDNRPFAMIDDLARLQQELQVETVTLALMQTELFPPNSDDSIAAATRAEQLADQAITKLPSDSGARREVERLKIESILRAGQYDRADRELKLIVEANQPPLSARWMALQTRLDVAQQRMGQAAARLDGFFGAQAISAPRSIEMDLARLEFLLRSDPASESGDWLEAIESRGGVYARRRAEAMALSLLGRSRSSSMPTIDPSIVAAQGQDYLRRGDPERAAELLAAAAKAETNPDRAIERAAEAAAAFGLSQKHDQASALLAETATANPQAKQAPAAHLQAALLVASNDPAAIQRVESMLRLHLRLWPRSETSFGARAWLLKLLTEQLRLVDAAEVATAIPVDQVTSERLDAIALRWQATLRAATEGSSEVSKRFLDAYRPLLSDKLAAERFPLLVALLVDRDLLGQVSLSSDVVGLDPFASALLTYRQRGIDSEALQSPPPELIAVATERLMRDGRQNPVLRKSIARVLARWEGNDDRSLEHAERLLWDGRTEESIKVINELIRAQPADAGVTAQAAKLLTTIDNTAAMQEGIRLWDQLAGGAKQGTPLWHEAKLSAIAALRRVGSLAEAQRRARYVLLTLANLRDDYRRQYEALAK